MEVPILVVDVNRHQSVWRQYGITATPTVIRFEGGRERVRIVGEQLESTWRRLLEEQKARMRGAA